MKKRNLLTFLLSVLMTCTILTGCGSSDSTVDKKVADNNEKKTEDMEISDEVSIEEQIILDENGIKITATGLEEGLFGTDLKLLIENSTDTNLTIQANYCSVNGFMVDTIMSEDVAAGKKSNSTLTFSTSGLKDGNITTIANMELVIHVINTDTWETYFDSERISIETSVSDDYVQNIDDSGTVFYDANGIRIIGKGLSTEDSFFGPGLILYIENNSENNITVQVRDTSVNGFMVDTSMSQDIVTGKKALTAATFFETSLEENEIEDIEQIETSFHIFDMDSWDTITDTEIVVINFEE